MKVAEVPLEIRVKVAWELISDGEDPYSALHAALWPTSEVATEAWSKPGYCMRGHELTEENTYIRPGGRKQCRACRAFHQRGRYTKKLRKKEPCVHCGAPATTASDKGTGGLPTPRCRKCFLESLAGRRR